jgi:hypothetical protein
MQQRQAFAPSFGRGACLAFAVLSLVVTTGCAGRTAVASPLLVDETGTVLASQFHFEYGIGFDGGTAEQRDEIHGTGAAAIEPPAGWDVRIAWGSRMCDRAPTVRVTGSEGRVTAVYVNNGPMVGRGECPAALVFHAVDLKTSRRPATDIVVVLTKD